MFPNEVHLKTQITVVATFLIYTSERGKKKREPVAYEASWV